VTETFGSYADAREAKRAAARRGKLAKAHAAGLHREEPRAEWPVCEAERAERERVEPTLRQYGAPAWTLAQRTASASTVPSRRWAESGEGSILDSPPGMTRTSGNPAASMTRHNVLSSHAET
jgi:hypothetical protein